MKFELKPDNRNSSDEDLIKDLVTVAQKLNKSSISIAEYGKYGRYSDGTLRKRFGGWISALENAGLLPTKDPKLITDQELLCEMKRIAAIPGVEFLSRNIFNIYKRGSNSRVIQRRFGSWSKALEMAGLNLPRSHRRYSIEELFENLLNTWIYHGRQPTMTDMGEEPSIITAKTYASRFGSWRKSLETFIE